MNPFRNLYGANQHSPASPSPMLTAVARAKSGRLRRFLKALWATLCKMCPWTQTRE